MATLPVLPPHDVHRPQHMRPGPPHPRRALKHGDLPPAVHKVLESTGTGFLYGTMFGAVLAGVAGVRESPKEQRLAGVLQHAKVMIPEHAGKIALVTCYFRVVAITLEKVRGKHDMYNTLLAAPIAGALLSVRRGPKAAARSAAAFGWLGAVMVAFGKADAKVRREKASPEEVLEEMAFGMELDEMDDFDL